ncbi:DedA family protein [Pseudonocardia spirodelae]|uniref:DedA family protein n=1 Tax=Pseudonocardia spirodelae TaxID=3133431 RepID=A0ABU8TCG3_9PSEU
MTPFDLLAAVPGPLVLALATVLVLCESALLVGVVLPGFGVPVAVGLLSASGAVPWWASAPSVCVAAAAGRVVAFRRGRTVASPSVPPRARAVPLVRACLDAAGHRPRTAVALSQWFAVVRTLVPRLVGTGLSTRAFVLVAVPIAVAWAGTGLTVGRLLHESSQLAAGIVGTDRVLAVAVPAVLVLALAVSWWRGRRAPSPGPRPRAGSHR